MDSSPDSWTLNAILPRALRIAIGVALFAAVLLVMGSAGAFASSGSSSASVVASTSSPDKGTGLLSGILSPVAVVVDKTVSQVPVVKDIVQSGTVSKVVAPVSTVTDKVESAVTAVPVVGTVVEPIRQVTAVVVPPVVQVVETVTSPVLSAVDEVTAPIVQVVSPVLDPITGTVRPVVDGVTDEVADVVDNVVVPVVPSVPVAPSLPGIPNVPVDPSLPAAPSLPGGSAAPDVPGASDSADTTDVPAAGDTVGSSLNEINNPDTAVVGVKADAAKSERKPAVVAAPNGVGDFGALAPYLTGENSPGASTAVEAVAFVGSGGGHSAASCDADSNGTAVGPCAPAIATSTVPGPASSSSAGGSGGSAGPVAADQHMNAQFVLAGGAAALPGTDWPLPASMPENPGSTPG